jgi:hypothetical protein
VDDFFLTALSDGSQMRAPQLDNQNSQQPSKQNDGPLLLAMVALLSALCLDVLALACGFAADRAMSRGDGTLFGDISIMFTASAAVSSMLAIPAMQRYPRLWWPYVAFLLGLLPLPLKIAAGQIEQILHGLGFQ